MLLFRLSPDGADYVQVAEADDEGWDDEDVHGHDGEVGLPLPPGTVAPTGTLVLDLTVGVDAHRYLLPDDDLHKPETNNNLAGDTIIIRSD